MADITSIKNIGALVAAVTSVRPQAASASVNGGSIDRAAHNMPLSCVLHTTLGADTGSPTDLSVQSKLQDSADNSTFADYEPDGANVAQADALTAVNTENALAVDLTAARRYIRVVSTIAFTGGTSPTIELAADVILGGESPNPAV